MRGPCMEQARKLDFLWSIALTREMVHSIEQGHRRVGLFCNVKGAWRKMMFYYVTI